MELEREGVPRTLHVPIRGSICVEENHDVAFLPDDVIKIAEHSDFINACAARILNLAATPAKPPAPARGEWKDQAPRTISGRGDREHALFGLHNHDERIKICQRVPRAACEIEMTTIAERAQVFIRWPSVLDFRMIAPQS